MRYLCLESSITLIVVAWQSASADIYTCIRHCVLNKKYTLNQKYHVRLKIKTATASSNPAIDRKFVKRATDFLMTTNFAQARLLVRSRAFMFIFHFVHIIIISIIVVFVIIALVVLTLKNKSHFILPSLLFVAASLL